MKAAEFERNLLALDKKVGSQQQQLKYFLRDWEAMEMGDNKPSISCRALEVLLRCLEKVRTPCPLMLLDLHQQKHVSNSSFAAGRIFLAAPVWKRTRQ